MEHETPVKKPFYRTPACWIILGCILIGITMTVCVLIARKNCKNPQPQESNAGVIPWVDYEDDLSEIPWDETKTITADAFPNVTFRWTSGCVSAEENGETRVLFSGMPITNVYFSDVTGDGKPELCATVYFGSGIVDSHIIVYDYANKQTDALWNRMEFDYHLYTADGVLLVGKTPCQSGFPFDKQVDAGTLVQEGGELFAEWQSDGSKTQLLRMLHESELYGEWLVDEETDHDGNVLFTDSLDLWKEYHFKEDGTVICNETHPLSSNYELAFGHPVSYPYEVHDGYVYIAADTSDGSFRWGQYDRETDTLRLTYGDGEKTVYATLKRMGSTP